MKLKFNNNELVIERTDNKKFYNESNLLHQVKKHLIKMGYDVIKKRMYKDGHLMGDDETQYIRDRNWKFAIYDSQCDGRCRLLHEEYNQDGTITLAVQYWKEIKQ